MTPREGIDCHKAVVLLTGFPASGKTTLIDTLKRLWTWHHPEIAVAAISVDALQQTVTFNPESWHAAREKALLAVRTGLELEDGRKRVVMVDDTMFYRSMRRKYFHVAVAMQAAFFVLHVQCSVQLCLERNAVRCLARLPEEVIQRTAALFEPPDGTRFYWECRTFVFDSEKCDARLEDRCEELAEALLENWTAAEKLGLTAAQRTEQKRRGQETNRDAVHQLDLSMRSHISERMLQIESTGAAVDLKACATKFNALRLSHLEEFKRRLLQQNGKSEELAETLFRTFVGKTNIETAQ